MNNSVEAQFYAMPEMSQTIFEAKNYSQQLPQSNFAFRPLEANRNKPDIDIDYRDLKTNLNKIMPGRKGGKKVDMSRFATIKGKSKHELSESQMN